ncbi:putative membrane protein YdjX (TVP38/TMEM64 family) [Aneurinibacillus soli]|uniref:TVP38/TMEM64 family membrane protein n=1 Tax=Aneurinibacillus soli TaxID=1500254 RepID=A0A0U5B2C2_9BACL|nr:VTT domain-containing protein [Aneurinibacillus soli]PYE61694.1 putative membrane protein YdjX (TVP38/TMEM64 family) [Aneurinibacillus soli]BAU28448.1 TVP38/TMEM64 family inner membrane protein YdjZ [Aneurinibacillus soli]
MSNKLDQSPPARYLSIAGLILFLLLTGIYMYLLHIGAAKEWLASIRHLGVSGIVLGIFIQTIVNALPVPGEFVSLFLIEVYGAVAGGFYSWVGGITGAVLAYYLSNWIARPLIEPLAKPYLEKVNQWLQRQGAIGLLFMRFVPLVPYHFINYAAGLLQVNRAAFIWTTVVGILPYTIMMSSLFAGLRYGKSIPFIVGAVLFILSSIVSIVLRKKTK